MRDRLVTVLMIVGALGAAGAAAYFSNSYIDSTIGRRRAELDSQYQPVRVVVANTDLRPGTPLSGQTVALREVPRAFLHSEAVPADSWNSIAGRVLARAVKSGEPVLQSHLAHGAGAGFSAQLAQGMRALTFPVDAEASIAGMLAPGDHIDIFFTTASGNDSVTLPLLHNVAVIATGIRTATNAAWLDDQRQPYNAQYNTVTVSVLPEDAAKITLAQQAGKISIALRQPGDERPLEFTRITKGTLLNAPRVARASSPRTRVEIILGGA